MATIKFIGNNYTFEGPATVIDQANSGIGFFGNGYGLSVPVGSWQDNTFITNDTGDAPEDQTIKLSNTKYNSVSGVKHNNENEKKLNEIPNGYAPLNIRFEHEDAVAVKNCQLRIFDRLDIENHAEEVHTKVCEIRHPEATVGANKALNHRPTDDYSWVDFGDGTEEVVTPLELTPSPGSGGLNGGETDQPRIGADLSNTIGYTTQGAAHESTQHDWYIALSASPNGVGSKTAYGLYFTLEYL